jgi:hypothetical protein
MTGNALVGWETASTCPGIFASAPLPPSANAPICGSSIARVRSGHSGRRDLIAGRRRRGVIFDIGHGSGSFGFRMAETMLTAGFLPDVISSDVHALSINGPAFDQLVTMSKFLCLGRELIDVIGASTAAPAAALGRSDLDSRLYAPSPLAAWSRGRALPLRGGCAMR